MLHTTEQMYQTHSQHVKFTSPLFAGLVIIKIVILDGLEAADLRVFEVQ